MSNITPPIECDIRQMFDYNQVLSPCENSNINFQIIKYYRGFLYFQIMILYLISQRKKDPSQFHFNNTD